MSVPNGMLVALPARVGSVLGLGYVAGRVAPEQRWDASLLAAE